VPAEAWTSAYDADGQVPQGAWVAELTNAFDLSAWPARMRLIVRKERPHPGAQLRITDLDRHRITAFVTNTTKGQLADLELRHHAKACGQTCAGGRALVPTRPCANFPDEGFVTTKAN
jgi:hypothetical protein